MIKNKLCADAGTRFCPCHLAYCGDCVKCSLIRGEETCDCLWQGTCIYNEVLRSREEDVCQRPLFLSDIVSMKDLGDNVYLLKITVDEKIVYDLKRPGTYILMKSYDKDKEIFNAPISIMDADIENSTVDVIIKTVGVKTKPMIRFDKIWLRGPYFNGIFGLNDLENCKNKNTVVLVDGLSQVNCLNVIKKLKDNNNKVVVFMNDEHVILDEITKEIDKMGVSINVLSFDKDKDIFKSYLIYEEVSLIYSAGCNTFNKKVLKVVDSVNKDIKFCISNNNLICCGEGICGACVMKVAGKRVKTCKVQVDSRDFLNSI